MHSYVLRIIVNLLGVTILEFIWEFVYAPAKAWKLDPKGQQSSYPLSDEAALNVAAAPNPPPYPSFFSFVSPHISYEDVVFRTRLCAH